MSDDAKVKLETLRCRRTGQMFSTAEHATCPYCTADAATIAKTGRYEQFCDYQAGVDPVHFGFPDDATRTKSG